MESITLNLASIVFGKSLGINNMEFGLFHFSLANFLQKET